MTISAGAETWELTERGGEQGEVTHTLSTLQHETNSQRLIMSGHFPNNVSVLSLRAKSDDPESEKMMVQKYFSDKDVEYKKWVKLQTQKGKVASAAAKGKVAGYGAVNTTEAESNPLLKDELDDTVTPLPLLRGLRLSLVCPGTHVGRNHLCIRQGRGWRHSM